VGEATFHESIVDTQPWPSQDLAGVGLAAAPVVWSPPWVGEKEEGNVGDITVCGVGRRGGGNGRGRRVVAAVLWWSVGACCGCVREELGVGMDAAWSGGACEALL
jgi:hypothetical protein